jgi:hypothetical protein
MTDNFYLALAAILLLPIIPAYILYKFLPASETDVSGPYQGLSLKLKGAFAGYFLLVLIAVALQYVIMNNKQGKSIAQLTEDLKRSDSTVAQLNTKLNGAVTDWYVKGLVTPAGKDGTRFFFDDGATNNSPDGSFELIKRCIAKEGTAKPPKWMCVYNSNTGFKVISLNRELSHPDISTYDIAFDDTNHEIKIHKPIAINSIEKDSIVAISNFIDKNPELKTKVVQMDPTFSQKAQVIKLEIQADKQLKARFDQQQLLRKRAVPAKS